MKTTSHFVQGEASSVAATDAPAINVPSASNGQVDASCNSTITVTCLRELYNAVGYTPLANTGNHFAVTGYLDQFANFEDLQLFFADQVPSAVNSSFNVISINGEFATAFLPILRLMSNPGGQNNQSEPGGEANLGWSTSALHGVRVVYGTCDRYPIRVRHLAPNSRHVLYHGR